MKKENAKMQKCKKLLSAVIATFLAFTSTVTVWADTPPDPGPGGFGSQIEESVKPGEVASPNTIFGPDDSKIISSTKATEYPYRCVAKLKIKFPDGTNAQGTGFLYYDNKSTKSLLATAAHCIYDGRHGGQATSITVQFPTKSKPVTNQSLMHVPSKYKAGATSTTCGAWQYDYGVIELPSMGLGVFGTRTSCKVGEIIDILGYRAGESQLRYSTGPITKVGTWDISFRVDTLSGQSGAPVYVDTDEGPYAVGIWNYNANSGRELPDSAPDEEQNTAAKLSAGSWDFMRSFR